MSVGEGADARAAAAVAVAAVLGEGRTLEAALAALPPGRLAPEQRAQAQALAYGTVRWLPRLQRVGAKLVQRRWEDHSPRLQALLLLGLYQLEYAQVPPHAAVSTTVEAAKLVGEGRAAGLVNACLRRFQREREALLAHADRSLAGRTAHPQWFVDAFVRDWPAQAAAMLDADNAHPPLVLRANARRISTAALAERLAAAGHATRPVPFAPRALVMEKPVDVRRLPEFVEGLCSVQDAAAQLAVPLLACEPGHRVLDACAAPGGKACHLLEETPELAELVALDVDPARAARIRENLDRLGLAATVTVGDALADDWWDGRPFDRILLDAPCSGTGVIRRHPDIKLLRRPADVGPLAERQRRLLAALWPKLAPGGRLVYATCSVLKAENADVVADFLRDTPGAAEVPESARLAAPLSPALPGRSGREAGAGPGFALLPGAADTDGFYYACLTRPT
ncbi:MAG: 16S rRNA (cytosine(967)-C(5))-methyltransferase RsmB [Steroidobacteraceae bacterium]|jgi:16S rRNA (cytosine967-C5)-methyltransferase|nr:16S rRNA (cytosine(967)-C(5))-methyltransferase RsmB [Steroidobacteraceae bacterium]